MESAGRRVELTKGLVVALEERGAVRKLVDGRRKFSSRVPQVLQLFALASGVVLDLALCEFRCARLSDFCKRTPSLEPPAAWIGGDAYLSDAAAQRAQFWSML